MRPAGVVFATSANNLTHASHNVTFLVRGKQIGRVKADAGYVGQVLMNLVVNACDAIRGGGTIRITTAMVDLDEIGTPHRVAVENFDRKATALQGRERIGRVRIAGGSKPEDAARMPQRERRPASRVELAP